MFKLRWKWPIRKADAAFQESYLKRLPKYRVLAVPSGPEADLYYLQGLEIASDAIGYELPVRVENTAYASEFRFDEKNGLLFRDEVDNDDYMYHVHVYGPSVPPGATEFPLIWRRSRMVMEQGPYRFRGAFRVEQEGEKKYLSWEFCRKGGGIQRPRWDTKDIGHASIFTIGPEDQGRELFVRILELPATSSTSSTSSTPSTLVAPAAPPIPSTPAALTYRLELIPVIIETL